MLNLSINGTGILHTLTTGSGRTAAQIATELNNNPTFATVADASASNLHNGGGTANSALYIRSRGSEFGIIHVLSHGQTAHGVIGLPFGIKLPDATAARRLVLEEVFRRWEDMIVVGGNIVSPFVARIGYRQAVPFGSVASAGPIYSGANIVGGTFDFDSSESWFEDPTPDDDSEYASGTGPGIDLLTFAMHEMGHALGWIRDTSRVSPLTSLTSAMSTTSTSIQVGSTAGFPPTGTVLVRNSEWIAYSSITPTSFQGLTRNNALNHVNGSQVAAETGDFDAGRLNIGVSGAGGHADPNAHPDDLMRPLLPANQRILISLYPDAARLSLTQGATIPMSFVSPGGSPIPDGRAVAPYPYLTDAIALTPAGIPIMITSGSYFEPAVPVLENQPREILTVRNGNALVY